MTLQECIEEIIDDFSENDVFDSHTVINSIYAKEEYLVCYLNEYERGESIPAFHSKIAKMIGETAGVEKLEEKSKSLTVFGNNNINTMWRKK